MALKTDKRRGDWLLGRWTAKRLAQACLGDRRPLAEYVVDNDPDGAPRLLDFPQIDLSISHSHGLAFCALSEGGKLGADIERIEARSSGFVGDYFTDDEIGYVRAAAPDVQDTLVTVIWSAKEAALKALRLGLRADTRAVGCRPQPATATPAADWLPIEIRIDSDRLGVDAARMMGWWRMHNEFVLTLAALMAARTF
jgi:4'-phosphopantetheinyl transferase